MLWNEDDVLEMLFEAAWCGADEVAGEGWNPGRYDDNFKEIAKTILAEWKENKEIKSER